MRKANTSLELLALIDSECGPVCCWPFLGHVTQNGYGHIRRGKKKTVKAHRWAYEHFYNTSVEGLVVMHLCDNRLCCNPLHLKAGSQKQNIEDMVKKGRKRKLCYKTIKTLRESGFTQKQIALKLECSPHTIWQILKKL